MTDYISRDVAVNGIAKIINDSDMPEDWNKGMSAAMSALYRIPAADVRPVPEGGIGEMSDGYHTFNGLYYQRMVLFASLVNAHQDKAWKSWKHEDGKPCFDGVWFIVGIDTPQGSYTYHYEDKYWNWFECEELPVAKHWDGHTEEDVTRLLWLDVRPRWIPVTERLPEETGHYLAHVECECDGEFMSAWMQVAWFCKKFYWEHSHGTEFFEETVTHWMLLPQPPKEE